MSAAAYSDLKAAWHIDRIATLRKGEQIVPAQVQLIISDLCNHDCHFCSYRMSGGFSTEQFADEYGNKNPNRRIPTAKCIEILDDCAVLGVGGIQFTGGGEPTVHPDHLYIFGHAQARGLQTCLVTNGCILRDKWEEVLPKMQWIRVSIDAGSAEEYARVRRVKPSNGWTVQGEAAADRIDFDGAEVGVSYGAVNFGMRNENHALYGFVGLSDVLLSSVASVGVGGQLHFEQATVNGSIGYADIGEALIDSGNLTNVHLDGTWFITDNFGISADAGWTEVEIDSSDTDWTTLGVGASYRFPDTPWTVYANYQNRDFEGGDIDSFRIGVRFDIGTEGA